MGAAPCAQEACGNRQCGQVTQTIFPCQPDAPTAPGKDAVDIPVSERSLRAVPKEIPPMPGSSTAIQPAAAESNGAKQDAANAAREKVRLPGGATYDGTWKGDQKQGDGILTLPDGTWYSGQFRNDKRSGYGTYSYPSGSTYCGQWEDDLQAGHGVEQWKDSSVFEGQFRGGSKDGWGRFSWGNGCSYEGEFANNDIHGEGSYTWPDGRWYSGQWMNNQMGPSGTMGWPDGRAYEGEFAEGRKHGHGTHRWPDGRSYCGEWWQGRQHGEGIARTSRGQECRGVWKEGKFVEWLDGGPNNLPGAPNGLESVVSMDAQGDSPQQKQSDEGYVDELIADAAASGVKAELEGFGSPGPAAGSPPDPNGTMPKRRVDK